MNEVAIGPGALEEDDAPPGGALPPVDEDRLIDEELKKEGNGPKTADFGTESAAPSDASGTSPEIPSFNKDAALRALEQTTFATMFEPDGGPVFTPEELTFLASKKDKGKIAGKATTRTALLKRSYRWRDGELARREKKFEEDRARAIDEAKKKAELAAIVEINGTEPWKMANNFAKWANRLGVVGADELVLDDTEMKVLSAPTRDVLLKFPRVARFLAIMNLPEMRLMVAIEEVYQVKIAAMKLRRAQAEHERRGAPPEPSKN